ncbi:hypothetical protein [Streptomyces sp. NRRL F-5123]|uniref:hypothetical protein n=1 Tax=Streptomyces sp. NRRL F-5123 TaxID=1463856 RepID=UPI0004E153A9|nr:hypothetical protein [Streptomyces sp. NRRL F-5123]
MRAPHALAATCVAVSAALLLSACGGSKKDDGKIKDPGTDVSTSAPAPTTTSAAPSPTAAGVKRPTITFPADAKDVFDGGTTGDPVKDAVLADNQGFISSVDDGFLRGSSSTDALGFYAIGKGLTNSITYIQGTVTKGYVWYGTLRYFDRKVTLLDDHTASVVYCSDENEAHLKDRRTGKVDKNSLSTSPQNYVLYNTHLTKSAQGVWQTDNIISNRGAKQCQP